MIEYNAIKSIKLSYEAGISEYKIDSSSVGCCAVNLMPVEALRSLKKYIEKAEKLRPEEYFEEDEVEDDCCLEDETQVILHLRNTDREDILTALRLWEKGLNIQSRQGVAKLIDYIDQA